MKIIKNTKFVNCENKMKKKKHILISIYTVDVVFEKL